MVSVWTGARPFRPTRSYGTHWKIYSEKSKTPLRPYHPPAPFPNHGNTFSATKLSSEDFDPITRTRSPETMENEGRAALSTQTTLQTRPSKARRTIDPSSADSTVPAIRPPSGSFQLDAWYMKFAAVGMESTKREWNAGPTPVNFRTGIRNSVTDSQTRISRTVEYRYPVGVFRKATIPERMITAIRPDHTSQGKYAEVLACCPNRNRSSESWTRKAPKIEDAAIRKIIVDQSANSIRRYGHHGIGVTPSSRIFVRMLD